MRIAPITAVRPLQDHSDMRCPECSKPLTNTGGYGYPRYRCIQRDCANTSFKPINPASTSFAARNWI